MNDTLIVYGGDVAENRQSPCGKRQRVTSLENSRLIEKPDLFGPPARGSEKIAQLQDHFTNLGWGGTELADRAPLGTNKTGKS